MRLFFYLNDMTPARYAASVAPMLRALTGDVHVMMAGEADRSIAGVHWHDPQDGAGLIARIAPDLTLATMRDATPLPGKIRYMLAADAAPFPTNPAWFVLQDDPGTFGQMPAGRDGVALCVEQFTPLWNVARAALPGRGALRASLGLPQDRRVFAIPLRQGEDAESLAWLIDHAPDDVLLAVSHGPCPRMADILVQNPGRVRAFAGDEANAQVIAAADAMVGGYDGAWSLAAYAGVPIWHVGGGDLAPWLGASKDPARLCAPDPMAARDWFAWHLAGRLVRPEAVDLALLLRHVAGAPVAGDIADNVAAVSGLMMG
jgi:hypothetical protein